MRLALALVVAAVAAVAVAASASADSLTFFRMPSRNIYCAREHIGRTDFLRCDVLKIKHKAPKPRGCRFGWGNSFGIGGRGRAHALCVSDSVFDSHAAVLRYGTTRRFGPFKCTSKTTGLRCSNRSAHGFVLNRAGYRFF